MTAPVDPLTRLVYDDAVDVDRELLAALLQGRVRLDIRRGVVAFEHGARSRMTKRQVVLVALLAQKALHLLAEQYPEALRPQEIEAVTGIVGNTLRPILKGFLDQNITRRDADGAHQVASYGLEAAARLLTEEGDLR